MNYTFIFDSEEHEYVNETVLPLLKGKGIVSKSKVYDIDNPPELFAGESVLLYLADNQIKELLPLLQQKEITISTLPHPKANRFCRVTGVDKRLEKAVEHLIDNPKTIDLDLLYCNKQPVITSVVIGKAFQLATSYFFGSISIWKKIKSFLGIFLLMHPFKLELIQKNGNRIKTAVSGVVVTTHKKNSILSGYIPGESHVNDGLLHALLICPRSTWELLSFAFLSLWKKDKLPHFGAHIKTDKIIFSGSDDEDIVYTLDGVTHKLNEIEFEVKKKAVKVIAGSSLKIPEDTPPYNEVFKTEALPTGEAAMEISRKRIPFIRRASTEEFKELFNILRENAKLKSTYMVLMALSTSLAILGLFTNSSPVIIGAMILAPLMSPIISLSMASLRQDRRLILSSSYTILAGLGISIFFAVILTWITPIYTPNSEILSRTNPNLVDLGIAVISGIAGAYAHAREEVAKTLAGVAIAVALVPPLAVAGIGLGWMDWQIFSGALLLLFTNLTGMVLAGSVTFMVLGFSPFRLASRGIFISLIIVILFSIPLALSFKQMLFEHRIVRTLDGWETENVIIKDVRLKSNKPLNISVMFVSEKPLNDDAILTIKDKIEEKIGQKVELEIIIALQR